MRGIVIAFLGVWVAVASIPAVAGGGKKEVKPVAPNSVYVPMEPSLTVNFGSPGTKLRYLRADIVLRLLDPVAEEAVKLHMPQLRHAMLMLLSQQTEEAVSTQQGKEQVRQQALVIVRDIIKAQPVAAAAHPAEEPKDEEAAKKAKELEAEREKTGGVTDLLFNNFVTQR